MASANIVVANLAARDGHPITFMQFFRYGLGVVAASLAISTVYLYFATWGDDHRADAGSRTVGSATSEAASLDEVRSSLQSQVHRSSASTA